LISSRSIMTDKIMTDKTTPLKSIEKIINDALAIFQLIKQVPQMSDTSLNDYQATCQRIPEQIRAGRLKIAVAGVIKSGKSTFVNSLVSKELVKRGAGVVTSITTRICKGKKNQARLYFKSWDEINLQLQKALLLFPYNESKSEYGKLNDFDIRRKKDRRYLKEIYKVLTNDFPVTKEGIRPETLMIQYALTGFKSCKDLVQADETSTCFKSREFDKHKIFTSDPNKAFYIKDVCLDVFGKGIDPNIEIGDCQGADSTDPAQLARILSYLESSNLIIYCISSRTGLRQADITFLNQIKNLGLLDNIVFINNCDLTEHENLEDLVKIETIIQNNLEFLEIQPQIFSFSSLYNLFLKLESKLNKKDSSRLRLWQEEKKMVQYCDLKTKEFNVFFQQVIDKYRDKFLISNHLKRLDIIMAQLDHRADIFLNLLSSDKLKQEKAIITLEDLHQNASRLKTIVANSIKGAIKGLKDEINLKFKNSFILDQAGTLKKTLEYIKTSYIDVEKYRTIADKSGFNQIIYLMFQDFKRNLDLYIIENVQPEFKKFVKGQEERITSYFQSLFDSYKIDLIKSDQYSDFENVSKLTQQNNDSIDIDQIKKILGLKVPNVIFEAKYTSKIKANAITDFGLQTLSQIMISLIKGKSVVSFSPGLKKAVVKIKKENQKVLKDQFEQYHITLRTNYFLPLIEAVTRDFKEKINERFSQYNAFKEEAEHVLSLQHSEKKVQKEKVLSIKQHIQKLTADIASTSKMSLG